MSPAGAVAGAVPAAPSRPYGQLLIAASFVFVLVGWGWELYGRWGTDPLLGGIWLCLTLLMMSRIENRRDVPLVIAGLFGGFLIEWWGTTTELWSYYTAQRPPPWIVPAWPVAALAGDRVVTVIERGMTPGRQVGWAYWVALPVFVVGMAAFLWPSVHIVSSQVVLGLMVAVLVTSPDRHRDVLLFAGGAFLGIGLEYWGTSRGCWTYYTGEVPPGIAVLAHGFASVAFGRAATVMQRVYEDHRVVRWIGAVTGRGRAGV
jgi:hypothetical protein